MITGDYGLSPPDLDEEIVKRIKGLRYNEYESAVKAIRELISKPGYEIIGASVEEFLVPVFKAAEKAYHNK
ncbi:hypothetical protein V6M85_03920 [Sulfolobus tengchongensis]|uniref:Uncharacterized protein n=1 Tax=Sulfolobus tengchongensis TaxID=207809 RepID=A0AAX4L2Y9_9CREN